jgi:hypothetical protein
VSRALLIAGGVINVLFGLFHVWLTWEIAHVSGLSPNIYGLLVALAVGGTMVIFFVAAVTLFCQREMRSTSIGRAVSIFTAAFYLTRVAEEFVLFSSSVPIAGACALTGAVYLALAARTRVDPHHGPPSTAAIG